MKQGYKGRKLFKGGNYSREDTIKGNTVCIYLQGAFVGTAHLFH